MSLLRLHYKGRKSKFRVGFLCLYLLFPLQLLSCLFGNLTIQCLTMQIGIGLELKKNFLFTFKQHFQPVHTTVKFHRCVNKPVNFFFVVNLKSKFKVKYYFFSNTILSRINLPIFVIRKSCVHSRYEYFLLASQQ